MRREIVVGVVCLILGMSIAHFAKDTPSDFKVIRENSVPHRFTNPFLLLEVSEDESFPKYSNLKKALSDFADNAIVSGKAKNVSVYFRDLNHSRWIAVNLEERYSPASMLKVVTVMSVLRAAESNPAILNKKVTIKESDIQSLNEQDFYPPQDPVQVGKVYTVNELLNKIIIESDNAANIALHRIITNEEIQETYETLRIPLPQSYDDMEVTTSAEYSHLFRVLYNGTYLSNRLSEQVLGLLTLTTFNHGLVAGVPAGTVVAHKFGERSFTLPRQKEVLMRELHDCGIIYFPDNPYLLCVMTRGQDFSALAHVIQEASSITWKEVEKLLRKSTP